MTNSSVLVKNVEATISWKRDGNELTATIPVADAIFSHSPGTNTVITLNCKQSPSIECNERTKMFKEKRTVTIFVPEISVENIEAAAQQAGMGREHPFSVINDLVEGAALVFSNMRAGKVDE